MSVAVQQPHEREQSIALDRAGTTGQDKADLTGTQQQQPGMEIAEAAVLLGIAVPTLRKRLQRGTQSGFKSDDGTWRVLLHEDAQDPSIDPQAIDPQAIDPQAIDPQNIDPRAIDRQARKAVGRSIADPARRLTWEIPPATDDHAEPSGTDSAAIERLTGEIRELRDEIERNSALLESTQWQIAQINPPGQFQHLQNHTETMIENQLRPVVSALMAVLDYLDRERDEARKAEQPLTAKK